MKKLILIFLVVFTFSNCEKKDEDKLIGIWEFTKWDALGWGIWHPETEDKYKVEYRNDGQCITYDYQMNEISRAEYYSSDKNITTYGVNINGTEWSGTKKYWYKNDTLITRADGGFEYTDYYYVKIK